MRSGVSFSSVATGTLSRTVRGENKDGGEPSNRVGGGSNGTHEEFH